MSTQAQLFKQLFAGALQSGTTYTTFRNTDLLAIPFTDEEKEFINQVGGIYKLNKEDTTLITFNIDIVLSLIQDEEIQSVLKAFKEVYAADQVKGQASLIEFLQTNKGKEVKFGFWAQMNMFSPVVISDYEAIPCFEIDLDNLITVLTDRSYLIHYSQFNDKHLYPITPQLKESLIESVVFDDALSSLVVSVLL